MLFQASITTSKGRLLRTFLVNAPDLFLSEVAFTRMAAKEKGDGEPLMRKDDILSFEPIEFNEYGITEI